MTREPQVRAVGRYRAPGYPSHEDPDPSREPYPVPYPLAPGVAGALVAGGLAAGCGSAPGVPAPANNPFPTSSAGIPRHASMFGTGEPSRLDADRARKLILTVFRDAGVELEKDVLLRDQGLDVKLDGYDRARMIGFVFADWQNLANDAFKSWRTDVDPPESLSLKEAEELERQAERGSRFVAVIGYYDKRYEWRRGGIGPIARALDRFGLLNDELRLWFWERATEARERAVLERLEKNVREYIAWARANGAV